jgi:cytidine deaminase
VTQDGHLFMALNNEVHIKDGFSGRGCAETSVLRRAQDGLHREDVQFKSVYLLSGMGKKQGDGKVVDVQPGHVACLCGECRENMRSHTSRDTRYIMLPVTDGTVAMTLPQGQDSDVREGQPRLISYDSMYPLPLQVRKTSQELADVVRKGYLFITDGTDKMPFVQTKMPAFMTDGSGHVRMHASVLQELMRAYQRVDFSSPALEQNSSPSNINRAMVRLVKQAYAEHAKHIPEGKNLKITVVMLKADDGKCYPGVNVEGPGWLPSKPQVFATALNNAANHIGFTEAYMMTFDSQQILGEMSAANAGVHEHQFAVPTPAGLGRLIKNLHGGDNPTITLLPVNDGALSDDDISKFGQNFNIREAFGPGFSHPKGQHVRGNH